MNPWTPNYWQTNQTNNWTNWQTTPRPYDYSTYRPSNWTDRPVTAAPTWPTSWPTAWQGTARPMPAVTNPTVTRPYYWPYMNSSSMGRKKRLTFTASFTPKYVNSDDVKDIAHFAEASLSSSENKGPLSLVKIVSAQTQVMNGLNYKLVLELIQKIDYKPLTCEVVVFDQSWIKNRQMIQSKCFPTELSIKDVRNFWQFRT